MAYTGVNKSTDYFNTKLYTGTGNSNAITGVGFQPDWTWIKGRSNAPDHFLFDAIRGATNSIRSNVNSGTYTNAQLLTAFGTDGFTVGTDGNVNTNGQTFVGWNWKANGAGSANTDGSINSTVSANNTSGFSIVKYTGTGSAGNVGHGLSTAPTFLINKSLATQDWFVGCSALGFTKFLKLNATSAASTNSGLWNDTAPTTDHFTINSGNGNTNASGVDYITYCFAEKQGFSKFGSYVGNGNVDGSFLYCGFKPAFIILKNTVDGAKNWEMLDNKRPSTGQNPADDILFPDTSDAESASQTDRLVDFVSNGFKIRGDSGQMNGNGEKSIFMAFAEAPLVGSNNVPANAR